MKTLPLFISSERTHMYFPMGVNFLPLDGGVETLIYQGESTDMRYSFIIWATMIVDQALVSPLSRDLNREAISNFTNDDPQFREYKGLYLPSLPLIGIFLPQIVRLEFPEKVPGIEFVLTFNEMDRRKLVSE